MATGATLLKGRNDPPSHYLFKIESFSSLSKSSIVKFCSDDFEAGGYEWKLWIYPTGDSSVNGKDYISFHLELVETDSLPTDVWEFHYHPMNTIFGISKFIDLNTFSSPANGYLFDDTCIFGVEVFVVKSTSKRRSLSMIHYPATYYHTWKVNNFSSLINEKYESESFGCYKWKILLYPNGCEGGEGNSISIFLNMSPTRFPPNSNLFVEIILRVKDQTYGEHIEWKGRNAPPSHYLFKIESFSSLSKSSIVKFCSDDFEAGGYKWKLWIYPTGDNSIDGKDYLSFYLELVETSSLPTGWEVTVNSNLFIFNRLQNKYFSNKDVCDFNYHSMNTIFRISKFIDLNTFSSPVNGYLFDDTCVFGVEVFVVKNTFKEGRLSMMRDPATNIVLYPNGNAEGKGNSISIFLNVSRSNFPPNSKLFVEIILRVKDQTNGKHIEYKESYLYAPSNNFACGRREFLSLAKLKDSKHGYLVDDTLIIEAEATLLGLILPKS
ncbi:hypothetical protein JRO89_XS09G0193300 [Xanthoceras sorbifolium]|uniref:MATH domain-containing protein n=1 Tax=Xanthoceras sorbifolium TaxID=99658 RepID=A0ABQ8HLZ7_9ROSI|nr:hypothetical protein JRO89_XS09G0193300 [Xanthoceras sorbifolium]